jgi:hypothetical protein
MTWVCDVASVSKISARVGMMTLPFDSFHTGCPVLPGLGGPVDHCRQDRSVEASGEMVLIRRLHRSLLLSSPSEAFRMTSGEHRCNDHLQVDLFYQLRREKNFFHLALHENNGCVFRDKISDEDSNGCTDHPDREKETDDIVYLALW